MNQKRERLREFNEHGKGASPGDGRVTSGHQECRRLRREVEKLREENTNIGEALRYFTKRHGKFSPALSKPIRRNMIWKSCVWS